MGTVVYHKPVRDRVPAVIKASGKIYAVETLLDDKY